MKTTARTRRKTKIQSVIPSNRFTNAPPVVAPVGIGPKGAGIASIATATPPTVNVNTRAIRIERIIFCMIVSVFSFLLIQKNSAFSLL